MYEIKCYECYITIVAYRQGKVKRKKQLGTRQGVKRDRADRFWDVFFLERTRPKIEFKLI